jgi:hypothetical protein
VNRVAWEAYAIVRAVGVPGAAGAAFALIALALFLFGVKPAATAIDGERHALERLQVQLKQTQRGAATGPGTTAERLRAFYAFFPRLEALPEWLDKVYAAAARHSITLEKGEYTLARERDGRLMRYQLILPVKGSYPQLRAFLENVLQDVPAAVLDSVTFQRESIAAPQVDAQFRFSLVLGGS